MDARAAASPKEVMKRGAVRVLIMRVQLPSLALDGPIAVLEMEMFVESAELRKEARVPEKMAVTACCCCCCDPPPLVEKMGDDAHRERLRGREIETS